MRVTATSCNMNTNDRPADAHRNLIVIMQSSALKQKCPASFEDGRTCAGTCLILQVYCIIDLPIMIMLQNSKLTLIN